MPSPTDFDTQIQAATASPCRKGALALEQLYRQASGTGQSDAFREAIVRALSLDEKSELLNAWGYRF